MKTRVSCFLVSCVLFGWVGLGGCEPPDRSFEEDETASEPSLPAMHASSGDRDASVVPEDGDRPSVKDFEDSGMSAAGQPSEPGPTGTGGDSAESGGGGSDQGSAGSLGFGGSGPLPEVCEANATEDCWALEDGTSLGAIPSDPVLGNCRVGVRTCGSDGSWGACAGAVAPLEQDRCDEPGADDDCNGVVNEGCSCVVGEMRPCGSDVGNCQQGQQSCGEQGWGPCEGEVAPAAVDGCFEEGDDANCNGEPNDGCECIGDQSEACGECGTRSCDPESGRWGPCQGAELEESCGEDTSGALVWQGETVGNCREGERVCQSDGTFSACVGAIGPEVADDCSEPGDDADCDGVANSGCPCVAGQTRPCGTNVGACSEGTQACVAGSWGTCQGAVTPKAQDGCATAGDDSDCNGIENEGCPCIGTETGSCNDCGIRTCAPSQRSWGQCQREQQIQECTPGTTTSLRTCSTSGTWTTTNCMYGCYGGQCGECQSGDVRCAGASGQIPQQCVSGAWVGSTACGGDTPQCQPTSGTCGCATNAVRCLDSSTPEKCVSGSWQAQSSCEDDTPVCNSGVCVCSNNALRCAPATSAAARQVCTNGAWQPTTACGGDDPVCIGDGDCGCVPADTRCAEPNTVANCNAQNDWVDTVCSSSLPACNGDGQCLSSASVPDYVGCGSNLVCDVTEQCCYNGATDVGVCEPDTPTGTTCATTGDLFEFNCDGPNDCGAGQVCCWVAYMRQVASCTADCSGIGASVLCDPADGFASNPACASGQSCVARANGTMTLYRCE